MSNKKIILIVAIVAITWLFTLSVFAHPEITVYLSSDIIKVKPKSHGYAIVTIKIPQNGYIYANPKGPGTGKETFAIGKADYPIEIKKTRYLPGIKYISPLDFKIVYIYKTHTSVCIPFDVHDAKEGIYSISIYIEALLCNDVSCTPIHKTITQKIQVDSHAPEYNESSYAQFFEPEQMPYNEIYTDSPNTFNVVESNKTSFTILQAILFGIIAGFLLNFMPCVLPVISLKIFSFISFAHHNPRQMKIMGTLFAAGILTSFIVLATLAAFAGYNWGQLFQHETFIVVMAAIIFALALSFFGVYTFNIPNIPQFQIANQFLGSYFNGIVATLLATPCSGPFLGATLTWSLTQHPIIIFMIFINIGLGMSLPYLLLTFFPSLMRFIPKPGEWMITFEHVMGFLLIATAIYLLSLLNPATMVKTLWFIGALSFGLWQWGRFGNITRTFAQRVISFVVLLILTITSAFIIFSSNFTSLQHTITYKPFKWEEIVASNMSQTAMVVFTADWCPNCKFVEATALSSSDVINFIREHDIQVYKADLTTKNESAQQLMQQLGAHSIPFLSIFPRGRLTTPIILRDIYTARELLEALKKAFNTDSASKVPLLEIPQQ